MRMEKSNSEFCWTTLFTIRDEVVVDLRIVFALGSFPQVGPYTKTPSRRNNAITQKQWCNCDKMHILLYISWCKYTHFRESYKPRPLETTFFCKTISNQVTCWLSPSVTNEAVDNWTRYITSFIIIYVIWQGWPDVFNDCDH